MGWCRIPAAKREKWTYLPHVLDGERTGRTAGLNVGIMGDEPSDKDHEGDNDTTLEMDNWEAEAHHWRLRWEQEGEEGQRARPR